MLLLWSIWVCIQSEQFVKSLLFADVGNFMIQPHLPRLPQRSTRWWQRWLLNAEMAKRRRGQSGMLCITMTSFT